MDMGNMVVGTLSPDGTKLFTINATSSSGPGVALQVIDLATWEATEIERGVTWASNLWLPDSSGLVSLRQFGTSLTVSIIRLDGREGAVVRPRFVPGGDPVLSPDGTTLYLPAFESKDGYSTEGPGFIASIDLASGAEQRVRVEGLVVGQQQEETDAGMQYRNLRPAIALSPEGSRLYAAHAESERLSVIDTATMEVVDEVSLARRRGRWERFKGWIGDQLWDEAKAKGGPYTFRELRVVGGGRYLAVTGSKTEACPPEEPCMEGVPMGLRVIDAATLETVLTLDGVARVAVSPDGRTLVGTGSWHGPPVRENGNYTLYGSGMTVIDLESLAVRAVAEPAGRFFEAVVEPSGRFALAWTEHAGRELAMTNGGKCSAAPCTQLVVVDLRSGAIVAQRDLHSFAAQIVGPR
jgi:YVTN family beta-propeller protein